MTVLRSAAFSGRHLGPGSVAEVDRLWSEARLDTERYEKLKDLVDESIDLMLNYRQSGHPGGSRSKVHMMLSLLLSGAMRWDLRRPWRPYGDRLVLAAGHTVPLVYATLAVLNEALRERFERTGSDRWAFAEDGRYALTWESLLDFRHRGGLPGHAEMAGKTLLLKFNTGPSGHGMAPAAGEALALKLAGAGDVKVFVIEGEGGLTPGASHEAKNSAWGLGLSNLVFLIDWNDFGIDPRPASSVVHGTPVDWFEPYGWRVTGTEHGSDWDSVHGALLEAACGSNAEGSPSVAWFKTRKGRGYGKYDAASHGAPWPMHSEPFWSLRKSFMDRYGVEYQGVDEPAPSDPGARREQEAANLRVVMGVLRQDEGLVDWLTDRLAAIADGVPDDVAGSVDGPAPSARASSVFADPRILDVDRYPPELWKQPGEMAANRLALGAWGSYVNSIARSDYGRPLFVACSADLAESTSIAGFAADFGSQPGFGWYERDANPSGCLLPTEITEFANAGIMAGLATVNLATDPFSDFEGYWGAFSTYGSFAYLKYGPVRLFSQLAQDCELKVGKLLWVVGHSGPETADDSRTHFGVFETGVTQLFPEGHVIDLHPWEYNEVPVVLAAALSSEVPVVALHLTRPAIEIPDRAALGLPSHRAAARGAYVLRSPRDDRPPGGTVFVRGTMSTRNLVSVLAELDRHDLNVKVVAAISPQLFSRQDRAYRRSVIAPGDVVDAMVVTNGAFKLMGDWAGGPLVREYSLSSDWDDRWRTGGTVEEVMDEAHLGPDHILSAIERFVAERDARLRRWRDQLDGA
jgi:transketolase